MNTMRITTRYLAGAAMIVLFVREAAQAETLRLHCAPAAITCVAVDGVRGKVQHEVPITFGQPFAAADVPRGAALAAVDGQGKALPLQIDQISSHRDGSIRFAILSTILPALADHEVVSLILRKDVETPSAAPPGVAALLTTGYDLKIEMALHSPQVTQIVLGDRDGATPGTPFRDGEAVTVALGDDPADRYTVTVRGDMAGGDFTTLTKIAAAMTEAINKGRNYRAYKIGEGGGFEKLWVTARDAPGRPFAVSFTYSGHAKLASHNLQEWAPTRHLVADARPALEKATPPPDVWLKGPVATEFSVIVPLRDAESGQPHLQLAAMFNVRFFANGQNIRTDVVMENDWTFAPAPGNVSYDISIADRDRATYKARNVNLYQHARWHTVLWSGTSPEAAVRYDTSYFFKSRIVSNYDTTLQVPEAVLQREATRLAAADTSPMGPVFIAPYMPMTGGREDIAPLPRWTALYLVSQDPRARKAMMANADASGGIPIHYRDRSTGQPVSIDRHPGIALFLGKARAGDAIPAVANGDTPWTPDAAHQPSLAYVPYLVTGDRFYLDELMFWANWDMGGIDPGYRDGAKGLIHSNQIRGQAWSMRNLGEAAMALPDGHPMKAYFAQKLRNNLQWYVDNYPRNHDREKASPLGWVERPDVPGNTAPWQDDFLALAAGHLAEAGYSLAEEFFRWQAQSTVGRWTHEAEGYCWTVAPGYYINVRTKSGHAISDWRTLFKENWPDLSACPARFPEESYPESPAGSVAFAEAMLALSSDFRIPGAREALRRLRAETPGLIRAEAEDPSWAIVPRGERVEKADIK
jgi:hypothetical protein